MLILHVRLGDELEGQVELILRFGGDMANLLADCVERPDGKVVYTQWLE